MLATSLLQSLTISQCHQNYFIILGTYIYINLGEHIFPKRENINYGTHANRQITRITKHF